MKITIGSTNPVKVHAVKEIIVTYDGFAGCEVVALDVASSVSDQPKSLAETVLGAKNRALSAFQDCDYSFGLESGLIEVPGTKTGMMNCGVCAIYNGTDYAIGISSAFECPPQVIKYIFDDGLDMKQAFLKAGLTQDKRVASSEGAIGILTKGRVNRVGYMKQAVVMAMVHLENPELYSDS